MNLSPDFMRGFWTALGVVVALYIAGLATGAVKKIV
jgi:hypothetical protein